MTAPAPQDPFASVVTAQTIYGSLQEMRGEMQADRTTQALIRREVEALRESDTAQEMRIRALEQWRWSLPVSALSAVMAAVTTIITAAITLLS